MPYKDKNKLYRNQVSRWVKRKQKAVTLKGGCCQECGFTGHYASFQFHHRNPKEKIANWNKIRLWSWDKVLEELEKCDLLCANCHAVKHAVSS